MLVVGMLIVTATTANEVRASGRDSMYRGFYNLLRAGAGKTGFTFEQCRLNFFALEHKRQEDGFAAAVLIGGQAGQTVAAVDQLFNGKLQ